jgi:hypothetical protein
MAPTDTFKQKRGRHLTHAALWWERCPLGRQMDRQISDEEDAMDAALQYAVWSGRQ